MMLSVRLSRCRRQTTRQPGASSWLILVSMPWLVAGWSLCKACQVLENRKGLNTTSEIPVPSVLRGTIFFVRHKGSGRS
uniref:Putative secreted protein n=1 Tax=Anopheles marajoara TaxID=58244 RepID=A0A2M4CCI6_9DIPT